MPFRFRLSDPPSDVAFLSLVDGEALYNAEGASVRSVKEATIRQMGWHRVDLPPDWFLSRKAFDTTRQLLEAMQCTMQYQKYCSINHERYTQKVVAQLRRCEEKCASAFEELIDLRESVAVYKQQLRALRQERQRGGSPPSRATLMRERRSSLSQEMLDTMSTLACSFCPNVYPSRHALDSHIRKRHTRPERSSSTAARTAAVSLKEHKPQRHVDATTQVAARQMSPGSVFVVNESPVRHEAAEGDDHCSLRKEISELRLAVARLREQQEVLQRALPPSYAAAALQQSAGKAVTPEDTVASIGPLPGLQQCGPRMDEKDILLRIHQELLRTGAELQQLQSACDRESATHEGSATDHCGPYSLRNSVFQDRAEQQRGASLTPSRGTRAALTLNPQSIVHGAPRTEWSEGGEAVRQRGSICESQVVVSPITPPTSVTTCAEYVPSNREDTATAHKQEGVEVLPLAASETLFGTLSCSRPSLETKRPAGISGKMSPSPPSTAGLLFGDRTVDGAGALCRHDFFTQQPTSHSLPRDSSGGAGDCSPGGIGTTSCGRDGEQAGSQKPEAPQPMLPSSSSHNCLPWLRLQTSNTGSGSADPMWANPHGSAPSGKATSWASGSSLSVAEQKQHMQRNALPTVLRGDATPSMTPAVGDATTNWKNEPSAVSSDGALQRGGFVENNKSVLPGEASQLSSGPTQGEQGLVDALDMVANQQELAQGEEQGCTTSLFHDQALQTTPAAPMPMLSVPGCVPSSGSAVASSEQPECRTSPGGMVADAGVARNSSESGPRGSLPSRLHAPMAQAQHSLTAKQVESRSTQKVIPVVHLVAEAPSESGDLSLERSEKHKLQHMRGERSSSPAGLPQQVIRMDESRQHSTVAQHQLRHSCDEDSSETTAESEDADSYSVEIPLFEASEQGDADDGPFSLHGDVPVEEGSNVNQDLCSHLVMEDVSSDNLAEATPLATATVNAMRLAMLGDKDDDFEEDASHFMGYSLPMMTNDGKRTPSRKDAPTVGSMPIDRSSYSYSYSYSDDEHAVNAQEGVSEHIRVQEGEEVHQASTLHDSAHTGLAELTSYADVTPVKHTREAWLSGELAKPSEDVCKAGAEMQKKSRHAVQGDMSLSINQQDAPTPKQQPPVRVGRSGKSANDELAIVARRDSSKPPAPAPEQVVKKRKGFFSRLFPKKGK
ncbi:zinc-finger protein, conserved [Leishmania tarentolae]|uniref:Zinc-finger protein, conserved n=1 Tax=Leishmania tarentolae TaxID=5689 RepID=A0A640KTN4_LEITA|nr:zinc-finger protein, conserved [Leishmania tarentolae]